MTTSVANPFTSFSFYNRKRRHREGDGFTHSHTALSGRAGVWMQAEVTVSHTVLPISSEAPAPPLGSSRSPFFGCKSGGPESEVTYPLSRSRRGLRSDSIPGLFTPLLPQTPPRNTPASELGGEMFTHSPWDGGGSPAAAAGAAMETEGHQASQGHRESVARARLSLALT